MSTRSNHLSLEVEWNLHSLISGAANGRPSHVCESDEMPSFVDSRSKREGCAILLLQGGEGCDVI